jgi:hypothetical protein
LTAVYQVQTESRTYTVTNDLTTTYRVLIIGSVQDETSGSPLGVPFSVQVSRPDLIVKTLAGGSFVVSGYPEVSFPYLATTNYPLSLTISAIGYRPQSPANNIPANSTFPLPPITVKLRRLPVRVQGRVVKQASDRPPVAGAKIVSVDDPNNPPAVHTCALRSLLYFDHASGVTVRERALTAIGSAKQLAADAPAGTTTLSLSNRTGLAANRIVAFGPDVQAEYAVIDSMDPEPSDLTKPGNITLRNGLNHSFAAGTNAQRVTAGAIGTSRNLAADANAGDGVLLLDGLLNVDTVEVADPTATKVEYHAVGALSDTDGFYRLDGVGRVSTIFLNASAAPLHDSTLGWAIEYSNPVNVLDFYLLP